MQFQKMHIPVIERKEFNKSGYDQVPKANENPTGKKAFFAMGDNSTDSLDGRAWGLCQRMKSLAGLATSIYQKMGFLIK